MVAGQEPKPVPTPTEPWVAEVPKNSTFTITITYSDPSSQSENATVTNSDRPIKVQVWRDSHVHRILVDHANGAVSEGFLFDSGFVIRSTANSQKTFVSQSGSGRYAALDLFSKDFQGTQWIAERFYQGVGQTENGPVYLYEQQPAPQPKVLVEGDAPPQGYRPLDYMQLNASIHVDSKTPATVRIGSTNYAFSPIESWSGKITVPENFQSSAESFAKQMQVLEALRKGNTK